MTFLFDEHNEDESQIDRVLEVLQRGPITTNELLEENGVSHRFASAICQLRKRGHDIITEKIGPRQARYTKVGFRPKVKITPEMQEAYYRTEHWRQMRQRRMDFDSHRCVLCHSNEQLVVHHWKYELFEENLHDLVTLCSDCHAILHSQVCIAFPSHIDPDISDRLEGQA